MESRYFIYLLKGLRKNLAPIYKTLDDLVNCEVKLNSIHFKRSYTFSPLMLNFYFIRKSFFFK